MNINLPFLNTPEWQAYMQAMIAGDPNAADLNPFNPNFAAGGGTSTPVPTDSYKIDGTKYGGQFANQDVNPFRTIDNGSEYGMGKNASAAQLYNHFHRKAALDKQGGNPNASIADYGLTPGHKVQTIEDFLARRQPTITPPPAPPPAPIDVTPLNPNTATSSTTNPRRAVGYRPEFDMAMQQLDRNNIFGQTANMYSNFQPPAPPTPPNMGGPMTMMRRR